MKRRWCDEMGHAPTGERGASLLEMLVALALMGTVLVVATYVEMTLLRQVREAEEDLPSMSTLLATRQLARDIREATDVLPSEALSNVPGGKLLLLNRSNLTADKFTLYRMEDTTLLRSQYLEDGTVVSEDRVLAQDLVRCALVPDVWRRAVDISLASSRGAPTSTHVALRTHPSVLPPPRKKEADK